MPFNPWVGELMLTSINFAPKGWLTCDGTVLQIAAFKPLFGVIGNTFGGDGVNTFALPDLRGRVAISSGQGPGLQKYDLGQSGGTETVTLTSSQLPSHGHNVACNSETANQLPPDGSVPGAPAAALYATQSDGTLFAADMLSQSGTPAPSPHENMQPYLVLQWVIAVQGDDPFGAA